MISKLCTKCGSEKLLEQFHKETRRKSGHSAWCKDCHSQYKRAQWKTDEGYRNRSCETKRKYYKKNSERMKRASKNSAMRRHYGIGIKEYEMLVEAQNGRCGLCGGVEPGGHGGWHVDHCHDTGAIRGLLCSSCNIQLGTYEKMVRQVGLEKITDWLSRATFGANVVKLTPPRSWSTARQWGKKT